MTMRAWFGRNLDQGGAGGGAQDARGARVGVLAQPGLEGADGGLHFSGEDCGEGAGPSTCLITLPSAGDAGDAAFLFFLDLVILGAMTGVLCFEALGLHLSLAWFLKHAAVASCDQLLLLMHTVAAGC